MQIDFRNSLNSGPFLLGQVYDTSIHQIDSSVGKTVIGFGVPVSLDPGGNGVSALGDAAKYYGIAIRTNYEVSGGVLNNSAGSGAVMVTSGTDQYPIGSQVSVMRMGRVVVKINTATVTTIGTPVYYTAADGVITSDTTEPKDSVQIGTLVTTASDGGLAAIQMCNVLINKLI